jgi:hypothetical protein
LGTITLGGLPSIDLDESHFTSEDYVNLFTITLSDVAPNDSGLFRAAFDLNLSETSPSSGISPAPSGGILGRLGHINPLSDPSTGLDIPAVDPVVAVMFTPVVVGPTNGVTTAFGPLSPFLILAPSAGTVPLNSSVSYETFTIQSKVTVSGQTTGGPAATSVPIPPSAWGTSALLGMVGLKELCKRRAA